MSDNQEVGMRELFWNPDLVEKLLPFLDAASTLSLAQSKISCIIQLFQFSTVVWDKMVRRSLPGGLNIIHSRDSESEYIRRNLDSELHSNRVRETFGELRVQLLNLIDILKMMDDAKFQKRHHLLDVISEIFSPDSTFVPSIKITCSLCYGFNGFKTVSTLGFLLLEEVEAAFGSSLQKIDWVVSPTPFVGCLQEPLLSAFASRVMRQNQMIERMEAWWVEIATKESAEALFTLVQNTDTVEYPAGEGEWRRGIWRLKVSGNIEEGGWAAIARALVLNPDCVQSLYASREILREGRRKDIRTIWEILNRRWDFPLPVFFQRFFKDNIGSNSWIALHLILGD